MAKVKFYAGAESKLNSKPVDNGSIYIADLGSGKASMTVDINDKRFAVKTPQTWNEVLEKPIVIEKLADEDGEAVYSLSIG